MKTYLLLLFVSLCLIWTVSAKNYYVVTRQKVNWYVALQNCLTEGLQLATINSDQEHKDLQKALQNAVLKGKNDDFQFAWISANDLGSEGNFVWMSTGQPMINAKWYPGEPSNNHGQDCVHTWPTNDGFQLADVGCEAERYYVCEDRVIPTVPTKKYHIMKINKVNWYSAFQDCLSRGYQLATIASQDDQDNIENVMSDSGNQNEWLWTSGTDLGMEGQFFWMSTSKPFTYKKWSKGQPDNANAKEHCMHIWLSEGKIGWNDLGCTDKLFYLCEEIPIKQDVSLL